MYQSHLCVALIMLFCCLNQIAAQNKELINHIDALGVKDYLELSATQSKALKPLLDNIREKGHHAEPVIVLKKSKHVSHDLIIVEVHPLMTIPGASAGYVHFFRADGELIRSSRFNLGYRENITTLKVIKNPDIDDYLIGTHAPKEHGDDPKKLNNFEKAADWKPRPQSWPYQKTFAFQNNEVRLIRLIEEDGKPRSNPIYVKHFNYGPVCDYTYEQIEQLLKSKSVIDQLHVLTWLNGRHFTEDPRGWQEHQHEKKQSIEAYTKAHDSPVIKQLIEELEKSHCYWVSDMAYWTKKKLAKPLNYYDPHE